MKLKHPDGGPTVETDNPDVYLSQGWAEVVPPKAEKPADEKAK